MPKRVLVVTVALLVVVGGTAAAAFGYDRATTSHILPGVRIAGIDVSGMTSTQAVRAIRHRAESALHRKVTIHAGDQQWTVTLASLGMKVNPARAVAEAFDVSGSLPWISRVYHRLTDHSVDKLIPLPFSYAKRAVASFVEGVVAPAVDISPQNAAIKLSGESLVLQHSRTGQSLKPLVSARRLLSAIRVRQPRVDLPVETVEPKATESTMGETLTVDLSTNTLHLWNGLSVERTYPVATARYGYSTPIGEWQVVTKVENPSWINPGSPWAASMPASIPPGPDNPLGTRALYLSAPGIRIHGTPEDSSIGTYASHGCIRMHIPDSEALYPLVPVGIKVIIYGAPPWGNINFGTVAGT